jgi:hypothetical protein
LEKTEKVTRIIACAVFKPAVGYLQLERRYPNLRLTYLPSKLHLKPQELKKRLSKEVTIAKERGERIICLYGICFPDIDEFCREQGILRVPGHYCYEMLLGSERFEQLIKEMAGTYFAERDLIVNFEEYCVRPLDLHDTEMRDYCFRQYRRLLYVRQPSDPDLVVKAGEVADFIGLSLDIRDVDYTHLEERIIGFLRTGFPE